MHLLDRHARFHNQLSPYVDGALSPAETARLEAHLTACDACRAELDELRSTVTAVRDLPQVDAPRSFALTPRLLEPRAAAPGPSAPPLALGMRLASAGVAVVLAFVVIGDLSDAGGGGGAREAAEDSAGRTIAEFSAADADREEPAGGAALPAPAATDPTAAYDAQAPAEDGQATTAPRAGAAATGCPPEVAGESGSTGTTSEGVGGPSSGGGSAGTAAAAATPTPQPVATLTAQPGVGSSAACEEPAIAGVVTPATAAPEQEPASDITEESLSADGALEAEDGGGLSTLRLVEIALAGALLALLGGVAVELALRRRAA